MRLCPRPIVATLGGREFQLVDPSGPLVSAFASDNPERSAPRVHACGGDNRKTAEALTYGN